jgi:hypothetical protein
MNAAVLFVIWLSSSEPLVAQLHPELIDEWGNPDPAPLPPEGDAKGIKLGITLLIAGALFTLWTWGAKRDDG